LDILCVNYSLYSPYGDDVIIQDGVCWWTHIPYTSMCNGYKNSTTYAVGSDVNKTKFLRQRPRPLLTRSRPPEVNKGTWYILLLSKWTPLLIFTVVMLEAQYREEIWVVFEKLLWPSLILWSQTGLVLRPTVSDHIVDSWLSGNSTDEPLT